MQNQSLSRAMLPPKALVENPPFSPAASDSSCYSWIPCNSTLVFPSISACPSLFVPIKFPFLYSQKGINH